MQVCYFFHWRKIFSMLCYPALFPILFPQNMLLQDHLHWPKTHIGIIQYSKVLAKYHFKVSKSHCSTTVYTVVILSEQKPANFPQQGTVSKRACYPKILPANEKTALTAQLWNPKVLKYTEIDKHIHNIEKKTKKVNEVWFFFHLPDKHN